MVSTLLSLKRSRQFGSAAIRLTFAGQQFLWSSHMGVLPVLRDAHIETGSVSFIAKDGGTIQTVRPEKMSGGTEGLDVEIPRSVLSTVLFDAIRDRVEYWFSDSIASLEDGANGVTVTFDSGKSEKFDLLIGADGLHSNTRNLVFGTEEPFLRYLGYSSRASPCPISSACRMARPSTHRLAVCQVHMPRWSSGRVALIGDAACAPSFQTGQGASLSLVTAYILAGEIASHKNHEDAFESYECKARDFVERNQYNATFRGSQFIPNDQAQFDAFLDRLDTIHLAGGSEIAEKKRRIHNSLTLPNYDQLEIQS